MAAERKTLMSIFDVLTMLGGLCLFLFGMTLMGQALERRAGGINAIHKYLIVVSYKAIVA